MAKKKIYAMPSVKSQTKFHVNEKGEAAVCNARKRPCPFGGESGKENHFDTIDEARAYADEVNESKYGLLNGEKEYADLSFLKTSKFYHKLIECHVYTGALNKERKSFHLREDRKERLDTLNEKLDGDNELNNIFVVRTKGVHYGKPQIMEVYNNGRMVIYDYKTHKVVTEFAPRSSRVAALYHKAGLQIEKEFFDTLENNERQGLHTA